MYTVFNMPIITTKCPDDMNEKKCTLRKYIKSGQQTFHISSNETYLVPNTDNFHDVMQTVLEMRRICNKCQVCKNQKAR